MRTLVQTALNPSPKTRPTTTRPLVLPHRAPPGVC